MSWIRDHFYYFVFPALIKLAESKNDESYYRTSVLKESLVGAPGVDVKASPDFPGPPELAKLRTLCRDLGFSVPSSWVLSARGRLHYKILRKTLLSAEKSRIERKRSRLLFPGRDVWLLEVMSRRRNINSVYVSELSRVVADDEDALKGLIQSYGLRGDELCVDTGFVGSIIRDLSKAFGTPMDFCLMSQTPKGREQDPWLKPLKAFPPPPDAAPPSAKKLSWWDALTFPRGVSFFDANQRPNQIFPNRRKARKEALDTEYLPKYFATGRVVAGQAQQFLSVPDEFIKAAILTSLVWRGSTGDESHEVRTDPKFV